MPLDANLTVCESAQTDISISISDSPHSCRTWPQSGKFQAPGSWNEICYVRRTVVYPMCANCTRCCAPWMRRGNVRKLYMRRTTAEVVARTYSQRRRLCPVSAAAAAGAATGTGTSTVSAGRLSLSPPRPLSLPQTSCIYAWLGMQTQTRFDSI